MEALLVLAQLEIRNHHALPWTVGVIDYQLPFIDEARSSMPFIEQ